MYPNEYGFSRLTWIYMDLHVFIWIYMDSYTFACIYLDSHASNFIYMYFMDLHVICAFTWIYIDLEWISLIPGLRGLAAFGGLWRPGATSLLAGRMVGWLDGWMAGWRDGWMELVGITVVT